MKPIVQVRIFFPFSEVKPFCAVKQYILKVAKSDPLMSLKSRHQYIQPSKSLSTKPVKGWQCLICRHDAALLDFWVWHWRVTGGPGETHKVYPLNSVFKTAFLSNWSVFTSRAEPTFIHALTYSQSEWSDLTLLMSFSAQTKCQHKKNKHSRYSSGDILVLSLWGRHMAAGDSSCYYLQ